MIEGASACPDMVRIRERLLPYARSVARRFGLRSLATVDDLLDHVLVWEWEKGRTWTDEDDMLACLRARIHGHALDLLEERRTAARQVEDSVIGSVAAPIEDADPVTPEEAREGVGRLRESLARIAWPAAKRRDGVAHYGVLLLETRLALVCEFDRRLPEFGDGSRFAFVVEDALPWDPDQRSIRLRAGGPSIGEVWEAMRPGLSRRPPAATGGDVARAIRDLTGKDDVGMDLWHRWTCRAREGARETMDPDDWQLLARLLSCEEVDR